MTRRLVARAQRNHAVGISRALLLLGSLAASCVLSEVTVIPSPGDGGTAGSAPNTGGSGGKSPAAAGGSSGTGAGGDAGGDGGGDTSSAGSSTAGSSTAGSGAAGSSQSGANQGGVTSAGSPSIGGQPEGEGGAAGAPIVDPDSGPFKVLVVSAAAGYVHATIANAVALVDEVSQTADAALPSGAKPGSQFTTTVLATPAEVQSMTSEFLADYRVLFFAHTTGELFSGRPNGAEVMAAVEAFMNDGGGWVGINGTIDLEPTSMWPWAQNNLTGSLAGTHGNVVAGDVVWSAAAVTADHPIIRGITTPWARSDEWYNLARNPSSAGFSILGTLASSSAPVVWAKEFGAGGRSVFTTLGHSNTTYSDVNFKRMMLQSILWAANRME
jgi:type 1 glutamine amidotransferase